MRMVPSRLDTRFEHCRARLAPNGCCRCHYRWATFERPTLLETVSSLSDDSDEDGVKNENRQLPGQLIPISWMRIKMGLATVVMPCR